MRTSLSPHPVPIAQQAHQLKHYKKRPAATRWEPDDTTLTHVFTCLWSTFAHAYAKVNLDRSPPSRPHVSPPMQFSNYPLG